MDNFEDIKAMISDLTALLLQENERIKQGDYQTLNASSIQKSVKLQALETALISLKSKTAKDVLLPYMQDMQKQVSINAVLLSSALNGVKSANERIGSILDKERTTGTYDRLGRSVNMTDTLPLKIKVL